MDSIDPGLSIELSPLTEPSPPKPAPQVDPYEAFRLTKYFASLNGVRALCCLLVIKEHVLWQIPYPRLIKLGWLGVDLFFTISGFLIVTLLIRERRKHGRISLAHFYARRTLRIFPIYYLLIGLAFLGFLAISPWAPRSLRYYLPALPVLLTYTQNIFFVELGTFFHCWSLAMEEQFYLVWPAVERFAGRTSRWAILGGALLINQAVNFGLLDGLIVGIYGGDPAVVRKPMFLITFTPILLGVVLAYLLAEKRTFRLLHGLVGYRWSPFFWLGSLVLVCELCPPNLEGFPRLAIHLCIVLMLGSLVIREDHFARPILASRPLDHLGGISYGIYLYHTWVIMVTGLAFRKLGLGVIPPWINYFLVCAITILVAETSFRFVERPLLKVKERFSEVPTGAPIPAA